MKSKRMGVVTAGLFCLVVASRAAAPIGTPSKLVVPVGQNMGPMGLVPVADPTTPLLTVAAPGPIGLIPVVAPTANSLGTAVVGAPAVTPQEVVAVTPLARPIVTSANPKVLATFLQPAAARNTDGDAAALNQVFENPAVVGDGNSVPVSAAAAAKPKNIIPEERGVQYLLRSNTGDYIYVDYSKAEFTSYETYFRVFVGKPGSMVEAKITSASRMRDGGTTRIETSLGQLYVPSSSKAGQQPTWNGATLERLGSPMAITPEASIIAKIDELGVYGQSSARAAASPAPKIIASEESPRQASDLSGTEEKPAIPQDRAPQYLFGLEAGEYVYVDSAKGDFVSYETYFRLFVGKPGQMVEAKIINARRMRDGGTTTITTSLGTLYVPSALKASQPTWNGAAVANIGTDVAIISDLGIYASAAPKGAPKTAKPTLRSFRKMVAAPEKKTTQFGVYFERSLDINTLRALVAPHEPKDTIVVENPQGQNYFSSILKDVGAVQQVVFALLADRDASLIVVAEETAKSIIREAAKTMPKSPQYQTMAELDYPIQAFLILEKKAQDIGATRGWTEENMTAAQMLQTYKEAALSYKQNGADQAPSEYAFKFSVYAQGQFIRVLAAGAKVSTTYREMEEKLKPQLAYFFNALQQLNSLEVRKAQIKTEADKAIKALAQ